MDVLSGLRSTALSVVAAVLPLVLLFAVFQLLMLKLPRPYVFNILKGTFLASLGLLLFLQGVHIGFLPYGRELGKAIAGLSYKWVLIPVGFLLGLLTTWGEPSVRILADQIEEASSGSIHKSTVLAAICLGVAAFVSLGMVRIAYGIPLLYILVPGYTVVILFSWLSDQEFAAIAIDAGGVATGPMANTFLLALALGVASTIRDQDLITNGLGLVALIALAPIVSVMVLGFILHRKKPPKE